jgi:hypothetical protein
MDFTLKAIIPTVSKLVQAELKNQVPVDTGALRKSIRVQAVESANGFEIKSGYLTYGIFVDSGTKRYHKPNPKASWNPNPGRGIGGIKPRYWTNLSPEVTLRISKLIAKETAKQIKAQLTATKLKR